MKKKIINFSDIEEIVKIQKKKRKKDSPLPWCV